MPPLVNDFELLSLPDHIVDVRATIIKFFMVPTLDESSQISSMEMVLVDEYVSPPFFVAQGFEDSCNSSIIKELVDAYQSKIREGAFATFINLRTAINCDPCKVSAHKLELLFEKDTLVEEEDYTFSLAHGLAFVGIDDFLLNGIEPDHLIDYIGLLSSVSAERVYLGDGRTTNMLMIELVDEYGFVDRALYGDHVLDINGFLTNSYLYQTIVVLQFVKASIEEDRIIMHVIPGVTRMLFNPDIPYSLSFRKRMSERGVLDTIPYVILDGRMTTLQNEFVKSFPRKSVAELGLIGEGGYVCNCCHHQGYRQLSWLALL
ncbi:hypothetical protein RIF29_42232 [Crotalaria pallida]|uniref:Uncharacterized protein n=1 Tax=Crotalaria pallida TaxID=3830 RepID=A0AAN9HSD2_CROPI